MNFVIEMTPPEGAIPVAVPLSPAQETVELLKQILEVQRDQVAQARLNSPAHDGGARWRAFLSRWESDFPGLSDGCRQALPILERSYGYLIAQLTEFLNEEGKDSLDNDFSLQEFLDRFGMRLVQLGTILNMVAPLAEAAAQDESAEYSK
jgi:hypothetical protein